MKKLIIVNGDIATGKTHLAHIIKDRFSLLLFTKDEYKESLADKYPYSTYEESHRLSIMAFDMLFVSFEKVASTTANNLILEGNFREEHMNRLQSIIDKYGYDVLHLDLVGSPEVLFERYTNRRDNENRHPVHAINNLNDFKSFNEYTIARQSQKKIGKVITINADTFDYQRDESLFKTIDEFLNK